jgi:TonB-dependent SusC/RagA subfamily outer membrane receptor
MAGKVSGVTINSTGGAGSSVSMIIRGATSMSTDNQPLFVIDGVPMSNTINNVGGFGVDNRVDYGNAIADLDPESIESVSILKGPSAAALYGTRAGNGVVLITTKKATGVAGMKVSVTSNTVFDMPVRFLDVQTQFSTGLFSFRPENVGSGILPTISPGDGTGAGPENDKGYWAVQWHSPLDANGVPVPLEVVSYPNNIRNFINDYGFTTTNGATHFRQQFFTKLQTGVQQYDTLRVDSQFRPEQKQPYAFC